VIRHGKTAYSDNDSVGFWIGVDGDGLTKVNIGGPNNCLLWTGVELVLRGWLYTPTVAIDDAGLAIRQGDDISNQLRFVDAEGATCAAVQATGDGSPWLVLGTAQPDQPGDAGRLDLEVDGDMAANVRLRLKTVKGAGAASSVVEVQIGNRIQMQVNGDGTVKATGGFDAGGQRVVNVADATADPDALNRQSGDARYLRAANGWTGTFATGDGRVATVVSGQVVSVA
jgi:hypothetical protein